MFNDLNFLNEDQANQYSRMRVAFRHAMELDHSVSLPSFGSLFTYDLEKPLGRAQAAIAKFFGVPFAYPSTNGTTPLNVMALLSITYPGEKILVQRDCHVSVLAGLIHGNLLPIYITPNFSSKLGVTLGVTPQDLDQALTQHSDVRTVFLTYPNYFGIAADIVALARVVAAHHALLIVDSAHGSHWVFHPSAFPVRPELSGARVVTLSIHKTGLSLGQGSLILFTNMDDVPRLYEVASLGFVSTSFSTVILSSLIDGIMTLSLHGVEVFSQRVEMAQWARDEINKIDNLHSFGLEEVQAGFVSMDPLRLTVDVSGIGFTGYDVEEFLIKKHRLYAEMATLQNILFLINPGVTWQDIKTLVECLRQIARLRQPKRLLPNLARPQVPPLCLAPRAAFYHKKRIKLPIQMAIGKISAETISAYPPGSAVVVAGEQVTSDVIEYLKTVRSYGGTLKGASDPFFDSILILDL